MKKTCIICNRKKFTNIFKNPIDSTSNSHKVNILQCNVCGFISISNTKKIEEKILYTEDYTDFKKTNFLHALAKKTINIYRAKTISTLASNSASILEVGCGAGDLLFELKKLGFNRVCGVEISPFAAKIAKSKGINVKTENFVDFNSKYKFNLIIMHHVIEHFPNPEAAIRKLQKLLKTNGRVLITTPNEKSLERKLFGKFWYDWSIPYHTVIFSPSTLTSLLEKHQIITTKVSFSPLPNDLAGSTVNFLASLSTHKPKKLPSNLKFALFPVFLPLSILTALIKTSSRFSLVARKR